MGNFTISADIVADKFSDGVYLCILSYSWTAGDYSNNNADIGDNNVFSAIIRDLLAGFSYGIIGSEAFKNMTSSE